MSSTDNTTPQEPPPPYSSSFNKNTKQNVYPQQDSSGHLDVPQGVRNGIPHLHRRSMEDESRELPHGWVRQYDSKSDHQFFVDTSSDPPRSIWHHPYDDDTYLSTLSSSERERINRLDRRPEDDANSADEQEPEHGAAAEVGASQINSGGSDRRSFGRKLKDKFTGSTHEERVAERRRRDEEEARLYRQHQHIRRQMSLAAETGEPQLLGKDKDGKDVYIEPPNYGYGGGFGGYGGGRGYGYNPYTQGPYSNPNARYIRPEQPYGRPYPGYGYGYGGYGGGFGLPLMGLGGGLLLGGLLF